MHTIHQTRVLFDYSLFLIKYINKGVIKHVVRVWIILETAFSSPVKLSFGSIQPIDILALSMSPILHQLIHIPTFLDQKFHSWGPIYKESEVELRQNLRYLYLCLWYHIVFNIILSFWTIFRVSSFASYPPNLFSPSFSRYPFQKLPVYLHLPELMSVSLQLTVNKKPSCLLGYGRPYCP